MPSAPNNVFKFARNSNTSFVLPRPRQDGRPQPSLTMTIARRDFNTIFDSAMARTRLHNSTPSPPNRDMTLPVRHPSSQRPFRATRMALEKQGLFPQPTLTTKYQGDTSSNSFLAQVEGLPDSENCCLWLTNIPLLIKHADIFDRIHAGAVFALHLNDPNDGHPFQAAKLVFMEPEAAHDFINSPRPWFRGRRLGIRYNKFGYRRNVQPYSRVLIITGPSHMMNRKFWDEYFADYSVVDWDRINYPACDVPDRATMEFRLARIDGQAQTCYQAVMAEPAMNEVVIYYGEDPCAASFEA